MCFLVADLSCPLIADDLWKQTGIRTRSLGYEPSMVTKTTCLRVPLPGFEPGLYGV